MQTTPRTRAILKFLWSDEPERTKPGRGGYRTYLILRRRLPPYILQSKTDWRDSYRKIDCGRKTVGCHVLRQSPRCNQPSETATLRATAIWSAGAWVIWWNWHRPMSTMPSTSSGASQTCPSCRKSGSIWCLRQHQKAVWHPAKAHAPPGCGQRDLRYGRRARGRTDLPLGVPASGLQKALFPPVAVQHGGILPSGRALPTSNRQLNTMRCTTQHSAGNVPTGWSASMRPGFFRACTVNRWR